MGNTLQDKAKRKFIEVLAQPESGGNISFACKAIGYSRQAVANWRNTDTRFEDAVSSAVLEGRDSISDIAEEALVKQVEKGNVTAIIFTLKSLRPERWGDRQTFQSKTDEQSKSEWVADTDHKKAFLVWMRTLLARNIIKTDILGDDDKQTLSRIFDKVDVYAKDQLRQYPD